MHFSGDGDIDVPEWALFQHGQHLLTAFLPSASLPGQESAPCGFLSSTWLSPGQPLIGIPYGFPPFLTRFAHFKVSTFSPQVPPYPWSSCEIHLLGLLTKMVTKKMTDSV